MADHPSKISSKGWQNHQPNNAMERCTSKKSNYGGGRPSEYKSGGGGFYIGPKMSRLGGINLSWKPARIIQAGDGRIFIQTGDGRIFEQEGDGVVLRAGDARNNLGAPAATFANNKGKLEWIHNPLWISACIRSVNNNMDVYTILTLISASGVPASIVVLILSCIIILWLIISLWLNTDNILDEDNKSMCYRRNNKSMWLIALTNMIVVAINNQSHDYILIKHNTVMWLIALGNMMVLIHVIYNRQLSFYYGTNDAVGRRRRHRLALKSSMGAAAVTLANNKGVEILAAAIDSSLTGGVATSAIHHLRLVLDSGATSHVVGNRTILQGYRELTNTRTGRLPDGSNVRIIGVGTIQTEHFTITNVYHVEGLSVNLISVSQLYRQYGMSCSFFRGRCGITLDDERTPVGGGVLENDRLYVLTNLHVPAGPVQE